MATRPRLSTRTHAPRLLLAAASTLAACTGGDLEPDAAQTDAPTERIAVVSLTWRAGEPGLAQAYVVDHAPGERKPALELLGVPTAGILLDSSPGLDLLTDQCRTEHASTALSAALLRDAGELLVSIEDVQQVLDFTWLPEGSLGASGAAYSALVPGFPDDPDDHKPRVVAVSADGSHEVGAFAASALLPEDVRLLMIGGRAVKNGRVRAADPTAGLEVVWAADGAGDDEPDLTLVLFERVGFGETWTIACAAQDDGAFIIPADALLALPDLGAYQTDRVIVRRVAGASFSARALPEGLLLVTSEDQAYLE